jgi:glyoxylase-like metal-dependent hydrolase (beta-lactamase superfamily II)
VSEQSNDRSVYEVLVVRYGTRMTVRSEVFLNYGLYGEPDGPIGMDYFFWVVRNHDRTVVVDSGFSEAGGANRRRTTLVRPPEAFATLGIRPEDEPTVVVTHAHYDHIGNLDLFDRSQVVIAQAELDFWGAPFARETLFHHSVEDADLDVLAQAVAGGRVQTFADGITVAPGIEVIRVGGHTPGQSVVIVHTAAGSVLLASDAVHYYEECDRNMPFVSVADLPAMYAGFGTVREMVASRRVRHVVSGHDPRTFERFPPDEAGPLPGNVAVIGPLA